jgi:RimJ/RimL family protein N-acetyltransferase
MTTIPNINVGNVLLRPKKFEDASYDYMWRCDEELATLDATTPLKQSYSEFLFFYREDILATFPLARKFAIDTLDGKHIGNCMCYDIDLTYNEAEIGIMIGDRAYWGKSYGYNAMLGLINHIFGSTNIKRLYLHTLNWNHRAISCFKKCGFTEVRTVYRQNQALTHMHLLRDQWLKLRDEKLAAIFKEIKPTV